MALGVRMSTPIDVLLAEAKEPPLEDRVALLSTRFIYRSLANSESISIEYLQHLADAAHFRRNRLRILKSFPILGLFVRLRYSCKHMHKSVVPPRLHFECESLTFSPNVATSMSGYSKEVSPLEIRRCFLDLCRQLPRDYIALFTDGSKTSDVGDMVGASSTSGDISTTQTLFRNKGVLRGDLALLQAIFLVADHGWKCAVIFTDSLSVVGAIVSGTSKLNNYIICSIKRQLASTRGEDIRVCWIPAHKGIYGNEMVDQAAKSAIISGSIPLFKVPYTDFYAVATANLSKKVKEIYSPSAVKKGLLCPYTSGSRPRPCTDGTPACLLH